ncbi:DUF3149 domain-containing protein [Ectothiorhodospiraceae bacterium WFHF3C12]|nr:DUF3149 domain-containing protein [Ectothiorhodospiraceae bacterium WFHF3C12]
MESFLELVRARPDFWLSAAVILFMLGMAGFFIGFFIRHIRDEEKRH